jgi:hypothetical protein
LRICREEQLGALEVHAHAEVEVGLGRAAHHRGEMEHRVGVGRAHARERRRIGDVALDEGEALFLRRGGREGAVEQRDRGDRLAAELPAREERPRQAKAEEAAAAGDEDLHAAILAKNARTSSRSRVGFIGGRLARTRRP